LRQQQEVNWAALQSFRTLCGRVLEDLQKKLNSKSSGQSEDNCQNLTIEKKDKSITQVISDLENINAHLYSIEALMERIFDVKVPDEVEDTFREVAGELAPDPLNIDRLRLNRLLHQTPDLPDK
jgi:Zn-dependent oligopeptidase